MDKKQCGRNRFCRISEILYRTLSEYGYSSQFYGTGRFRIQKKYERMFTDAYPRKVFGEDIQFEELAPEIQDAYAVYNHEYYLQLFEKANELFHLSYTYYFVPTGENEEVMFVLDAVRETKDGTNIDLGIVVDEDAKRHEKLWEAWNTGQTPSGYESYNNEYGKTYA